MLTVGITQLVVIVGRRREGKRKRRGGRMKKGATIILVGTQVVYLIVGVDCGVFPVLVGDSHTMVLAR